MTKVKNTEEKNIKTFKLLSRKIFPHPRERNIYTYFSISRSSHSVFSGASPGKPTDPSKTMDYHNVNHPLFILQCPSRQEIEIVACFPTRMFRNCGHRVSSYKLTTCFPSFCCQKNPYAFSFLNPSASVSSSSADDLRPCGHTIEQIKNKEKVKTQQTRSECCGSWRQALDPNRRRGSGPVFHTVGKREGGKVAADF